MAVNIGLILAGGFDPGFQMDIPKQFVIVENRPVIVYTLQVFQNHPEIDMILVSCLSGWQEMVKAYGKQFNISKLAKIVEGGPDGQESIRRGVVWLTEQCRPDDVVVIHDAIRPLVTDDLITDSIRTCREKGMGVAAVRSMDTVMLTIDGQSGRESISRYHIRRIQTPQSYRLEYLEHVHQEAIEKNVLHCVDNNSMLARLGETIHFSKGSDFNIKLNSVEDVEMFKALYRMPKPGEGKEQAV
jgi:2-C-methyl-D-erythritol 4-phosphate cytidylyltransferase